MYITAAIARSSSTIVESTATKAISCPVIVGLQLDVYEFSVVVVIFEEGEMQLLRSAIE